MNIKKIIYFIILIVGISFGTTLTMKANIGVEAWDALAQSGSAITNIPVGTVLMILNITCVLIQWIILKKDFKFKHMLQIPLSVFIGYLVNYFYYDLFGNLIVNNYFIKVLILILGYLVNAFVVAGIMMLDVVTFALEGACKVISDKYQLSFPKFRQFIDVLSVASVIVLSMMFHIDLYVREGTVIGMLIFGPMIGFFTKILEKIGENI